MIVAGSRDWTMSPPSDVVDGVRAPRTDVEAGPTAAWHHELVALEQAHRAAVGLEQPRRLAWDLVQHDAPGSSSVVSVRPVERQVLRERAGAPLELVDLAALEGATRGGPELVRELEVVVRERAAPR